MRTAVQHSFAAIALAVAAIVFGACAREPGVGPHGFEPGPTRGYVLISIDTLRADHLGAYGYPLPTSPFFDRLAARGTLFTREVAQVPATLPSHMTIFTGLYPGEHGVVPPSGVLASTIPTLPEIFRQAGFRTSGHTEGGYMLGGYGFARGFEDWSDTAYESDSDVDRTFARGVEFLRHLKPGERFFLFLHTYSVHDPYVPLEEYRKLFWPGEPPAGAFPPTGENFASFNRGRLAADARALDWYRALYDASIRNVDHALESLAGELAKLGLDRDTTLVVTSDHGEEFREHGRLVHTQLYDECLHVPLLVVHPAAKEGARVDALVESVDLAPTLWELAGLRNAPRVSGRSLVPHLREPDRATAESTAFAENEMLGARERALYRQSGAGLLHLLTSEAEAEADGFWVSREIRFDTTESALAFRAVAYHETRSVAVEIDGRPATTITIPPEWTSFHLELPGGGQHSVHLRTSDCVTPFSLGQGHDDRCLSFKIADIPLGRIELYDLASDVHEATELSASRASETRALLADLRSIRHALLAAPGRAVLTEEQEQRLRALGYL